MPMTANGLAKLLEELGELSQVAAKRLAYFHTSTHPDGAGDLNTRMEDEIGDVMAACGFVAEQFGLSMDRIDMRTVRKRALFQQWHADPSNGSDCFHAPRNAGVATCPDCATPTYCTNGLGCAKKRAAGVMASAPGPWEVVTPTRNRNTWTVRRNLGDAGNNVEWLLGSAGAVARFRSESSAREAAARANAGVTPSSGSKG